MNGFSPQQHQQQHHPPQQTYGQRMSTSHPPPQPPQQQQQLNYHHPTQPSPPSSLSPSASNLLNANNFPVQHQSHPSFQQKPYPNTFHQGNNYYNNSTDGASVPPTNYSQFSVPQHSPQGYISQNTSPQMVNYGTGNYSSQSPQYNNNVYSQQNNMTASNIYPSPANNNNGNFTHHNQIGTPPSQKQYSQNSMMTSFQTTPLHSPQNNEMQPSTIQQSLSSEFHPIACINCRKMHKKLPSCNRCESKGIVCEYKTPRRMRYPNPQLKQQKEENDQPKKKKKKSLEENNTVSQPQAQSSEDSLSTPADTTWTSKIPQTLTKKHVIDIYFRMICDHFIIIDRALLEKHILHKSSDDEVESDLPYKKEMQCFYFVIQALVEQRLGMGDQAEKTARKARDMLSKLFDEVSNYVVACAYASLGAYEIGSGRVKLSKFYLRNAKFYFEEMDETEKQKLNEYEKALQKYLSSIDIVNADSELGINTFIHNFPKVFEYTTGHPLPQEIVKATQQEVSPSNCLDYLKIIEMVASYLNKYFRSLAAKNRTEREMEIYDRGSNLCQSVLLNGLRVGVLTKAGYGKQLIEESSLRISYSSESEFFPFLPVIVIPHVALASRIHLQICKKIENGTRQNNQKGLLSDGHSYGPVDYFEILTKDYRALNVLSKRFKRVSLCYGSLMDEIGQMLKKRSILPSGNATAENNAEDNAVLNVLSSTQSSSKPRAPIGEMMQPSTFDAGLPPLSFLIGYVNETAANNLNVLKPPTAENRVQFSQLLGGGHVTDNASSSSQSPLFSTKSPSQQELYFVDPFFTHEDLQQIFSPSTYGDFEEGELNQFM
ncbi:hypothetical protein FDP41_010721 [Naegleria fowleri]|uniref:Zn(2)-C6 fungal-type domain-containing protein n=1 Tax=Naegleria fowleri TaxID=5763 RepID=A0A6A5C799_NAEFO|nr:uncharacterized protein FDP41_010721 [Naegleria fowleri]KAF0982742.1 hypothetical protein FDP41_010721 [Naegleria fowleri]